MALTKFGTYLVQHPQRCSFGDLYAYHIMHIAGLDKYAADADMYQQLLEDMQTGHYRDRPLGKIPDYILQQLREELKRKRRIAPIVGQVGTGKSFEGDEYWIRGRQVRHLVDKRVHGDNYNFGDVVDLLKNVLHGDNTEAAPSFRKHRDAMALTAPRQYRDNEIGNMSGRSGDTDMVILHPHKGKASINTGYTLNMKDVCRKLSPET